MNLFLVEAKRVLKTKRTFILLIIIFLLSIVTAYMPISFESYSYVDSSGNTVNLNGLEAVKRKKEVQSIINGDITSEKLSLALESYKNIVNKYGNPEDLDFPKDIYSEHILPIRPLLRILERTYNDDLMNINFNSTYNFYEINRELLDNKIKNKDPYISTHTKALSMYDNIENPFKQYSGYSANAYDYLMIFMFLLVLLCTIIVAPIFSSEYQTGSDSILRCTKHGRQRLVFTKIIVSLLIFIITYILCISIHLTISNLAFGKDTLKTSLQMLYSSTSLPNLNLGQTQLILVAGGFLSLLSMTSCTLYLSAKCKDDVTASMGAIIMCISPILLYSICDTNWLTCILPSSGVALQSNLLYTLTGLEFLHIGQLSIWAPYVTIVSSFIEIPIFLILTVIAYCKHEVI